MADNKRRPLLDGLTKEERSNVPLLLERVYLALGANWTPSASESRESWGNMSSMGGRA